ncbi:CrcB family protein [Nocardioides sp. zg-DK7169]|uniref:fluoride efflux transporter FluC n=1 Tax=Nocardioides sp. zg-DK7169 TaxID=2736600 RepID=UPI00155510F0|nr:CrcB family protein [Nocardioides sp. zg-DK7169]NPC96665.1 CrcB family protein [Nocardioides sp. zg-DK7169]
MSDVTGAPGRDDGGQRKRPSARPAYLHPASIALVLVGGGIGAGCREVLSREISGWDGVPVVVPVVNLLGAFLLGFLYQGLTSTHTGAARTSQLKALLGTGFCGGLTTYSSLATDTAVLLDDSRVGVAVLYALGTVVLGACATVAGIAAGAQLRPSAEHEGGVRR